jgi:hypothetical protein
MRAIPAASRYVKPHETQGNPGGHVGPFWGLSEDVFGEFSESGGGAEPLSRHLIPSIATLNRDARSGIDRDALRVLPSSIERT